MSTLAPRPSTQRMRQLLKTSCEIFQTVFNPDSVRTGNKVLRRKMKGPAVISYYPIESPVKFRHIRAAYPMFEFPNTADEHRVAMNELYVVMSF
ncbi:mitochondrial ribosomal subunit S27-domain-containing protein [Lipomyces orientalis]|uniref:Mitochondrial ribosomal subunit S27-domain-containing protein n=1 Tax=Lipomyces orientalis TaxID=1233043 RepID=A0ACC3TY22_9ASCO